MSVGWVWCTARADLYLAWAATDPGRHLDAKAETWRARVEAMGTPGRE